MEAKQTTEGVKKMSTASETTMHPFERAGLGIAPFRFVCVAENKFQAAPGEPIRAGGSCDYCGTGIMFEFHITGSDGKSFKVGSDCVAKLGRKDNAKRDPVIVAIADAARKLKTEARHAREAKRIHAGRELFEDNRAIFAAKPHRGHWRAKQGDTMEMEIDWYFANAGNKGKIEMCKLIDAVLNPKPKAATEPEPETNYERSVREYNEKK